MAYLPQKEPDPLLLPIKFEIKIPRKDSNWPGVEQVFPLGQSTMTWPWAQKRQWEILKNYVVSVGRGPVPGKGDAVPKWQGGVLGSQASALKEFTTF